MGHLTYDITQGDPVLAIIFIALIVAVVIIIMGRAP
jgi:hypothetical protein